MRTQPRGALAPVPQIQEPPVRPHLVGAEPEPPRHPGRWISIILFVITAVTAGWLYLRPSGAGPSKRVRAAIRTATVRVDSVRRTVRLTGTTAASRFAMLLAPQMTGTRSRGMSEFQQILQSVSKAGSYVKKGEVVAEFDRLYMLTRLDDYRSSVVQHEANLRSLNALLEMRRKNYEQTTIRYRGARDKASLETRKAPVLSAIKAENNRLNYQQYEAQLKEIVAEEKYFEISEKAAIRRSELDLEVSRLELERAERNADAMLVKAPIDGLLVMQTVRRGSDTSEIRAGDQLYPGQPYMQIVDTGSICVDAAVNQVDIEKIRLGASARVYFDAYPGLEVPARVISIGAMAASKGWRGAWVKDVPVRLKLENTDPRVIPNFSVAAEVLLEAANDVTTVPRESLFADPEDGSTIAFVRVPAGWEKRELAVGLTSAIAAEVKSGLNTGEVVAAEWPLNTVETAASPK